MELKKIIKKAGGGNVIAKAIGRHPSAISKWKYVPAAHVPTICKLSKLKPEDVRPDLYEWINQPRQQEMQG